MRADALDPVVGLERIQALLAPEPTLLDSAKRRLDAAGEKLVDEHLSRLEITRQAQRAHDVSRIDSSD